jgi:ribose 5-phosphate isomerase
MAMIVSKQVFVLGKFPLPAEVIGFAEAIVSEKIAALGPPARRQVQITACTKKS